MDVLGERDPRYDLPLEDRWAAGVRAQEPRYSPAIKKGIAETVALLGARWQQAGVPPHVRADYRVAVIVTRLLRGKGWRTWTDLAPHLRLLAEAEPAAFLEAIRSLSDDDVRALFRQEAEMGGAPHVHLLWALEIFAWEPTYLARAALELGRLAQLDPGGRLSNRPADCLREIFLPWIRHTRSDLVARLSAIDAILRERPDAGWRLLMDLTGRGADTSGGVQTPRFRDWAAGATRDVTIGEYHRCLRGIARRALVAVGEDDKRWADLIANLPGLPEDLRDEAIGSLENVAHRLVASGGLDAWASLRRLLHHHRSFPESDWAWPAEVLDRLAAVYNLLAPPDLIER
ncbi:MAG: hypothetical protein ACREKH_13915, partial [Candidatus Rokuibacteriota bacterium]